MATFVYIVLKAHEISQIFSYGLTEKTIKRIGTIDNLVKVLDKYTIAHKNNIRILKLYKNKKRDAYAFGSLSTWNNFYFEEEFNCLRAAKRHFKFLCNRYKIYVDKKYRLHRNVRPAYIGKTFQFWYKNGVRHRIDYPAMIIYTKYRCSHSYIVNGKYSRKDDEPSSITFFRDDKTTVQYWYKGNTLHRIGGPAVINSNGKEEWLINGEYHREDGPARTHNKRYYWFIKDNDITKEVRQWAKDHGLRSWKTWNDTAWLLFKLKFNT